MEPPQSPTACGSLPPQGAARLRPGEAGSAAHAGFSELFCDSRESCWGECLGDAVQVTPRGGGVTELQRIGDEGVAYRDLQHVGYFTHKFREVVAVEVVAGVDAQAGCRGGLARAGKARQDFGFFGVAQARA
jgi:hypothetical protein